MVREPPKHPDLIYDVGMHRGEDAEFYLRKGFRVVAFEADPDLVAYCRNRLSEFIISGQLTIVEGAITDAVISAATSRRPQQVDFYKNCKDSFWGTTRHDWLKRNSKLGTSSVCIQVDVVDFATVIAEHGVPHYMKIDIEGCDLLCIHALQSFAQRPDYLSIESSKTSLAHIKYELDILEQLGYNRFQAVEQSALHYLQKPPYPATEGTYADQRFEKGSSGLFGSELPDRWKSKRSILSQYRLIHLGYRLLGDEGMMNRWHFRGAKRLRSMTKEVLRRATRAAVPGWYDTHARHCSAR